MDRPLIILDADGVFLNERPYWDTALCTSLRMHGIAAPRDSHWRQLTDIAFDDVGLQRVTKRRGCNSNWDLAAVLMMALRDQEVRSHVTDLLAQKKWRGLIDRLATASNQLWERNHGNRTDVQGSNADPLAGFGVDRGGDDYAAVQEAFQQVLSRMDGLTGTPIEAYRGGAELIRTVLTDLRGADFELTICTGRPKSELLAPLHAGDMLEFFNADRLVTADDVTQAEQQTGVDSLAKPHWYSVVCAALGSNAACAALLAGRVSSGADQQAVYVGDGVADFQCAKGARSIGLDLRYIHVRSGTTDPEQDRMIADAPITIAAVDSLAEAAKLLLDMRERTAS